MYREPEHQHIKKCLARMVICYVENVRDLDITDTEFQLTMNEGVVKPAMEYYSLAEDMCICP